METVQESTGSEGTQNVYARAIIFATFSLLAALLIWPPLTWHFKNRNIGATVLVACVCYANFQSFLNAILWSNDDFATWYKGEGLCDVEVKLQIFLVSAAPASISCVLRALAKVMDTERSTWGSSKAQRRRAYTVDLVCCIGIPLLQIPFHWIVQPFRYYVYGISGCTPPLNINWVTVVLILTPPALWALLNVYYSVLIVVRLIRYRLHFRSILANNQTTRSRFMRLYALCVIYTVGYVPLHVYLFIWTLNTASFVPFSWNNIHHPTDYDWNTAVLLPSAVVLDRWMCLASGFVTFLLLGFGKDAMRMYREGLLACGCGRIWPSLKDNTPKASMTATISSVGSKARLYFSKNRKDSMTTNPSTLGSFDSSKSLSECESSPRKLSFLETVHEGQRSEQRVQNTFRKTTPPTSPVQTKAPWKRLTSYFKRDQAPQRSRSTDQFILSQIDTQRRVEPNVTAAPVSPTTAKHIHSQSRGDADVLVTKEVRQNSETPEAVTVKDFCHV
ncbi:hypothetical protein Slin15195_G043110 [Septoria linicola]|uniref:Uncharacterized protein n=1 Tax=Septoria linicola TaxID=215465 RepID=A0A9Q9AKC6_9PEZI|nr:hypothetical protein Slin14017_G046630 [Septoria linicola]USW50992.1 hypothetical protein Slin15195_G043110 [Septoria linicola]